MDTQKILELAGKLLLASATDQNAEVEEISSRLAAEMRQSERKTEDDCTHTLKDNVTGFLKFSEKETFKMPKQFRKKFRLQGRTVHVRKRSDYRYSCSYELRYRRNGYNISVSAPTVELVKARFIEMLNLLSVTRPTEPKQQNQIQIPDTFQDFSLYFYDKFRFRKVAEETKKKTLQMYKLYLLPTFGTQPIISITPEQCQNLIDDVFIKQNKKRTAVECFSILNQTFKMAIRHSLIAHNPCDLVFLPKYEKKHGKVLSKDEERLLLEKTAGTPYQLMFAVALYTGLRPNEIKTAQLDGNFIKAVNSKQKDGKVHYKRIPITPMLAPYLVDVTELHCFSANAMRDRFNSIFGQSHILKDLRKTFNTRCQECKVADVAREKFMGHTLKGLNETYTELSDAFLYEEGQKLRY